MWHRVSSLGRNFRLSPLEVKALEEFAEENAEIFHIDNRPCSWYNGTIPFVSTWDSDNLINAFLKRESEPL